MYQTLDQNEKMRGQVIETSEIINGISNYGRNFINSPFRIENRVIYLGRKFPNQKNQGKFKQI